MRVLPTHCLKLFLRALHFRRVSTLRNGAHLTDFVGDQARVGDNHLIRLLFSEIGKLFKHLLGGTQIDTDVAVGIRELHALEQDLTVDLVLLVHKVRVTRRANRDGKLLAERHNTTVEVS